MNDNFSQALINLLLNRSLVYQLIGRNDAALADARRGHRAARIIKDPDRVIDAIMALCTVNDAISKYRTVLRMARMSLRSSTARHNNRGRARSLYFIGLAYQNIGDHVRALKAYRQALKIATGNKDLASQGESLNNIGTIYDLLEKYGQARKYYLNAMKKFKKIDDIRSQAYCLNNIGFVYGKLRNYPQALKYHRDSLNLSERIGDRYNQAICLHNIGYVTNKLNRDNSGLEFYQQALEIFESLGDPYSTANVIHSIGRSFFSRNDLATAREHFIKVSRIARLIDSKEMLRRSCISLSQTELASGDLPGAQEYARQAQTLALKIKSPAGKAAARDLLKQIVLARRKQGRE